MSLLRRTTNARFARSQTVIKGLFIAAGGSALLPPSVEGVLVHGPHPGLNNAIVAKRDPVSDA